MGLMHVVLYCLYSAYQSKFSDVSLSTADIYLNLLEGWVLSPGKSLLYSVLCVIVGCHFSMLFFFPLFLN